MDDDWIDSVADKITSPAYLWPRHDGAAEDAILAILYQELDAKRCTPHCVYCRQHLDY